jgi:serine/threonine protein kinase
MRDFEKSEISHPYTKEVNLEHFEVIKVIGRGSFAKVYLVMKVDGNGQPQSYYAMKVLKKRYIFEKN